MIERNITVCPITSRPHVPRRSIGSRTPGKNQGYGFYCRDCSEWLAHVNKWGEPLVV